MSVSHNELITFKEAAKRVPGRCHVNTLRRWGSKGHKGVILETWRCARRILTSAAAIDKFISATTGVQSTEPVATSSHQQAVAQLDAMGV
jgi:hypothetical protein